MDRDALALLVVVTALLSTLLVGVALVATTVGDDGGGADDRALPGASAPVGGAADADAPLRPLLDTVDGDTKVRALHLAATVPDATDHYPSNGSSGS